jgi:hypothetical protein
MKNNEWNIPSDYFEKNKKALMPVRKFPTVKWLLALAAACVIGVGFFMLKGEDIGSKYLSATENIRAKNLSPEKKNLSPEKKNLSPEKKNLSPEKKNLSPEKKNLSPEKKYLSPEKKNLSPKDEIAEELKEIPREDLVAYLLEEDSELIENID